MLPSFFRDTVTRLRAGTRESRGSVIPDWSNPDELAIPNCSLQPATTSLSQDGRVLGISDGQTLYAPADADVLAGDRISFDGKTYEVDGDPRDWRSASGGLDHLTINLRRHTG